MMQVVYPGSLSGNLYDKNKSRNNDRSFSSDYLKEDQYKVDWEYSIIQRMIEDRIFTNDEGDNIINKEKLYFLNGSNDEELQKELEKYEYEVTRIGNNVVYVLKKNPNKIITDILNEATQLFQNNNLPSVVHINYDTINKFTSIDKFIEYISGYNNRWIKWGYCESKGIIQITI